MIKRRRSCGEQKALTIPPPTPFISSSTPPDRLQISDTTISEYANMTYEEYNDVWEALDAGPCPAGHFCPTGTEDPEQCRNASVRSGSLTGENRALLRFTLSVSYH